MLSPATIRRVGEDDHNRVASIRAACSVRARCYHATPGYSNPDDAGLACHSRQSAPLQILKGGGASTGPAEGVKESGALVEGRYRNTSLVELPALCKSVTAPN